MELTLLSRSKRIKQKIERDHQWYDQVNHVMLYGRGGEMKFVYDPQQKRSIPVIVDHEEWINRNDYPEIKKWVKDNKDKYNFSVEYDNGRNIMINVDENDSDEILRDLYIHNITVD